MNIRLRLLPLLTFLILTASCTFPNPLSLPPPGWRSPVSLLFVDEAVFPEGWQIEFPEDTTMDPTVNHVWREWGRPGYSGGVNQQVWRAYTAADAEERYSKLRASQFEPSRPLPTGTVFIPFEPPTEISFQSWAADEFYLACGWWGHAYCEMIARYRNYTVELRLDLEAKYDVHVTHGLTYAEIETVIRAMDAKFAAAMETFYGSPGK